MKKRKTVAIFATPGIQLLDASGPLDVFAKASAQAGTDSYQLRVAGRMRERSVIRQANDWNCDRA